MKRILFYALIAGSFFISCSSDDDNGGGCHECEAAGQTVKACNEDGVLKLTIDGVEQNLEVEGLTAQQLAQSTCDAFNDQTGK